MDIELIGSFDEVKNLIKVVSSVETEKLLQNLASGQKVVISIHYSREGKKFLVHKNKELFQFDVCRRGNSQHNVVSVLRDLLIAGYPAERFCRREIEKLIEFNQFSQ